jgi:hypothetical protein
VISHRVSGKEVFRKGCVGMLKDIDIPPLVATGTTTPFYFPPPLFCQTLSHRYNATISKIIRNLRFSWW